ncbi:hypothetical protein CspeluHIS016_0100460 [Cutaneotrichosporon spelunceum]|uniref:Uncharacterized protein n=1 Tax=Cutaneotrichosporon spelunceum TaxID=1672016 RepID=A0AAD3TML4_9TREE|nr:hypothetical protein CspeluHIS016_0100460 [Cutaneotrichosporon spelunceum]
MSYSSPSQTTQLRSFTPPPTQTRFFTPSSPTPSDVSASSQSPSSPIPAFVRMADEEALDGVTDDDIVKWCCYRDDEFMEVDDDDE